MCGGQVTVTQAVIKGVFVADYRLQTLQWEL